MGEGAMPVYKVVVAGNGNVGKTSLIRRYCEGKFEQSRIMTIGVDFQTKVVALNGCPIRLSIWDVAGQDRFDSFRDVFYRGARAVALVYDVTSPESFADLCRWHEEVRRVAPLAPVVVIANKIDLLPALACEEAEHWARSRHMAFLQTSASTGQNVEQLFWGLARLSSRA